MKVAIVRGGGIAGMVTVTELDSAALPGPEAKALTERVDRAGLRNRPEPAATRRQPDELAYEIVLDDGDRLSRRFSEATLPDEVRLLVEWVDGRPERSQSLAPP